MPETAAGRDFASDLRGHRRMYHDTLTDVQEANQNTLADEVIDAIEAQARALGRAEALAAVRAAVEGLPNTSAPCPDDECRYVYLRGVLAAIDNLETRA